MISTSPPAPHCTALDAERHVRAAACGSSRPHCAPASSPHFKRVRHLALSASCPLTRRGLGGPRHFRWPSSPDVALVVEAQCVANAFGAGRMTCRRGRVAVVIRNSGNDLTPDPILILRGPAGRVFDTACLVDLTYCRASFAFQARAHPCVRGGTSSLNDHAFAIDLRELELCALRDRLMKRHEEKRTSCA